MKATISAPVNDAADHCSMHSHTLAPGLPVLSLIFQLFWCPRLRRHPDTRWLDARQIEYRSRESTTAIPARRNGDAHACAHA